MLKSSIEDPSQGFNISSISLSLINRIFEKIFDNLKSVIMLFVFSFNSVFVSGLLFFPNGNTCTVT